MRILKMNYQAAKEMNGGQTSIQEKIDHLQRAKESLKDIREENERLSQKLIKRR